METLLSFILFFSAYSLPNIENISEVLSVIEEEKEILDTEFSKDTYYVKLFANSTTGEQILPTDLGILLPIYNSFNKGHMQVWFRWNNFSGFNGELGLGVAKKDLENHEFGIVQNSTRVVADIIEKTPDDTYFDFDQNYQGIKQLSTGKPLSEYDKNIFFKDKEEKIETILEGFNELAMTHHGTLETLNYHRFVFDVEGIAKLTSPKSPGIAITIKKYNNQEITSEEGTQQKIKFIIYHFQDKTTKKIFAKDFECK